MSDDLSNRGPADRSRINVNEPWELDYWSKKYKISPQKLREAVQAVGVSVSAVEGYLGRS